jgi:hypothetical protein
MQRYPNTIVVPETNSAHVNLWCSKGCRNNDNRDFGVFLDMVHLRCGHYESILSIFDMGQGSKSRCGEGSPHLLTTPGPSTSWMASARQTPLLPGTVFDMALLNGTLLAASACVSEQTFGSGSFHYYREASTPLCIRTDGYQSD